MKTPFCEVYVARGFCRLKPLETRPNVCLTIITNPAFALYLLATCYFVVVCGVLLRGLELQQIVPCFSFQIT